MLCEARVTDEPIATRDQQASPSVPPKSGCSATLFLLMLLLFKVFSSSE